MGESPNSHESVTSEPSIIKLDAIRPSNEQDQLRDFTPEEQATIRERQHTLSGLARFIGKDFRMPVELNEPGEGWHWDFQANIIRCDPKDLLEKPLEYNRFVVGHEGSHRRISRFEGLNMETWQQPGFAFMCNAIEDPRVNNFLVESYPSLKRDMEMVYKQELDFEAKSTSSAQEELGQVPRHIAAGFEYIKQWVHEQRGEEIEIDHSLPPEVQEVVRATLEAARDAWWTYPSKSEADSSEELIGEYAKSVSDTLQNDVWPEFRKLMDMDIQDMMIEQLLSQIAQAQEQMQAAQDLWDSLDDEQKGQLTQAIESAIEQAQQKTEAGEEATVVDMNSLPEELKAKLQDYLDQLPESEKQARAAQAEERLQEFDEQVNEDLSGKMSLNPERQLEIDEAQQEADKATTEQAEVDKSNVQPTSAEQLKEIRDAINRAETQGETVYERARREVLPLINKLEGELSNIFTERRTHNWRAGYSSGKRINIAKRIQEKVKGVAAPLSRSWERRELPLEKDYAFTLLIDLSGSMGGPKIEETFKAAIVLSEVLSSLSIAHDVTGFNSRMHEFKGFSEDLTDEKRALMGTMLQEVQTEDAGNNDDGWALKNVSEQLSRRDEQEKFVVVLSDGQPAPSWPHSGNEYDLNAVVSDILRETDQRLIGLGILADAVRDYYPDHLIANDVHELSEKLAGVIEEAINNPRPPR